MPTPEQVKNIHQAFLSGKMSPEEATQWQADIDAGKIQLPVAEVRLPAISATQDRPGPGEPIVLPQSVIDARARGEFSESEEKQFQEDLASGKIKMPEEEPSFLSGFFTSMEEQITGAERSTPEIEAMSSFRQMPEKTAFTMDALKASLATLTAGPDEIVQIMQSTFPDIKVRQDDKGNYILTSAVDGKDYAIKPGLRMEDVGSAIPATIAYVAAAGATGGGIVPLTLGAMGVQTGIELTQAAAGGDVDIGEIALAGAGEVGGVVLGRVLKAGFGALKQALGKAAGPMLEKIPDLKRLMGEAARNPNGKSAKILAAHFKQDPELQAAAKKLGIELDVTTGAESEAAQEVAGVIKSFADSPARQAAVKTAQEASDATTDVIAKAGGKTDLSEISDDVLNALGDAQKKLDVASGPLYDEIDLVMKGTPTPTPKTMDYLEDQIKRQGGKKYLEPLEKQALELLSPTKNKVGDIISPPYDRVDKLRRKINRGLSKQGEFKNESKGLLIKLRNLLLDDQRVTVGETSPEALGIFDKARGLVKQRKDIEDKLTELGGSIVGDLKRTVTKFSEGDVSKYIDFIKNIPKEQRQEVMASGLTKAFSKSAVDGSLNPKSFISWYDGLKGNKKAMAALLTNLPPGTKSKLDDVYRVSKAIKRSSDKLISTGKANESLRMMDRYGNAVQNIKDTLKRTLPIVAFEVASNYLGVRIPGIGGAVGYMVGSSLQKNATKESIQVAADNLLTSQQFLDMVVSTTPEMAKKLMKTSAFKQFIKEAKITEPEKWLLGIFQASKENE
ncbi:hypothetical protein KAR91_21360 [Candidatus Pacearchaeota archaeon]|nr:hypothetical protein [Candidatus Pacearchaeota archaeon]